MTHNHQLLAVCGLYCGACYHYRAASAGGAHLLEAANRPVETFGCQGCRSDTLYIHPGCAECGIRACADARGFTTCADCPDMPCERLLTFRNDGRVHHLPVIDHLRDIAALGANRWLANQSENWRCTCGAPFSWYETTCAQCGASLPSYGPDPSMYADG
jgi:hypothetical protein